MENEDNYFSDSSDCPFSNDDGREGDECEGNNNNKQSSEWSTNIRKIEICPFNSFVGSLHELPQDTCETEYLGLFLDTSFYQLAAEQTNLYAEQSQSAGRRNTRWQLVTAEEMEVFVGILIYMEIVVLPNIAMYFGDDFVQCRLISDAMTYDRFRLINQYLHFNDNTKIPQPNTLEYDKLYKIRPVLNIIDKFKYTYRPEREISVDEAMIAYKGHFPAKQYIKNKPTKWGLKLWVIAEATSAYVLDALPYLGKKEKINKELLLGEQVVIGLSDSFGLKNHHLYCDNFFTSIILFDLLKENQIYGCGTIRINRKEWPVQFKNVNSFKMKRGEITQMQNGNITATVWQDTRPVTLLSNNCDSTEIVSVRKYSKPDHKYVDIPCLLAISNYNKFMGGVDLADQKETYYSVSRPSTKWWKFYFYFVLDVCLLNSHIIYNKSEDKPKSQLDYRKNIVKQSINNSSTRKRNVKVNINCTSKSNEDVSAHLIVNIDDSRHRSCALCAKEKRKTKNGYYIQTSFQCLQCNLPLCKYDCFNRYHLQSKD